MGINNHNVIGGGSGVNTSNKEFVLEIFIDGISNTFTNEAGLNSWLEGQFSGFYNEKLVTELEKKGCINLIARYMDSSRIERWLFIDNKFYTQRMKYFLDHFKDFIKIYGKGKLSKSFALRLLEVKDERYGCGNLILNYPDSFEFYGKEPTENKNSLEKFKYENYGKIADIDIIKNLILSGYDLLKIKELNNVVGKFFEGKSGDDIIKDPYIQFLDGLVMKGYEYADDNRENYIKNYKNSFKVVEDTVIKRISKDLGKRDISEVLDKFEIFSEDMLSVLVSSSQGWGYIENVYESGDENKIKKFSGLDFKTAVINSLNYYFNFDMGAQALPWMVDSQKDFVVSLLDLGTDDKKIDFISQYVGSSLKYIESCKSKYRMDLWSKFKRCVLGRIDSFGLRDNSNSHKNEAQDIVSLLRHEN